MTQNNTQSVCSNAEAVNNNHIPSFEEVYAMPYVQDSINSVIKKNVRQYPVLAGHEDDLRQEILIYIWQHLSDFSMTRSSLKTFVRILIKSGMTVARRTYFSEENLTLAYAADIKDFENIEDENTQVSSRNRQIVAEIAEQSADRMILEQDVRNILQTLSPELHDFSGGERRNIRTGPGDGI